MKISKPKRMTLIFILSIGTAFLAMLSGYFQYKEKLDSTAKSLEKEKEIKELYQKLEVKSDAIITSTEKIVALQDELQVANKEIHEKAAKIIELQQNNLDELTGGDSYPHLEWYQTNNETEFFLKLINSGKFPLRNLRVCIGYKDSYCNFPYDIKADLGKIQMNAPGSFIWPDSYGLLMKSSIYPAIDKKFEVLAPGQAFIFTIPLSNLRYQNYNIYCSTERKGWVTLLRLTKKDNKTDMYGTLNHAIRTFRIEKDGNIEIFSQIPPPPYENFLVNEGGDIRW